MPILHPRRRLGGGGRLDQRGHVRDWAPPGWYWEVLPSGTRSLVRRQPVVDPELIWWWSCVPVMVGRASSTAEVVSHRVSEEDEHVRRYMVALEGRFDNTWQVLQGFNKLIYFTIYRSSLFLVSTTYLFIVSA